MTTSDTRTNIEIVIEFLEAMRRKDLGAALAHFSPEVVWEGLVPGVECQNRDAVEEMLAESIWDDIDANQVEVIAGTDHAVLGVRSAELKELAGVTLPGQLFNVFRIRDGRIVHVHDFALRDEALSAAGVEDASGWQ